VYVDVIQHQSFGLALTRAQREQINQVAEEIARASRPGRSGWLARRRLAARREVEGRYAAWRAAEIHAEHAAVYAAQEAERRAAKRARDEAGVVLLEHGPYGHSYFGSGGAYGRVLLDNAEVSARGDSGFIAGPTECRVVDRSQAATVRASGGDCIGDDGRTWGERWAWSPESQSWDRIRAATPAGA
jgi:hypothetical protein